MLWKLVRMHEVASSEPASSCEDSLSYLASSSCEVAYPRRLPQLVSLPHLVVVFSSEASSSIKST